MRTKSSRIVILTIAVVWYAVIAGCANLGQSAVSKETKLPATKSLFIPSTAVDVTQDYLIGSGDVLEISVWKDPALSRQVVVLPDGTISFPLIGKVVAANKSVPELKEEMAVKISRYVPEPDMTIILHQVNSMVIYVIGKVNRPGHITLNRSISVLQALSMAGGFNIFADQSDIQVIRETDTGTLVIPFDYKAVTEENKMEENIRLQRGDVIVVK